MRTDGSGTMPPLVPVSEAEERERLDYLAARAKEYRQHDARREAKVAERKAAEERAMANTPEAKAARVKANAALRSKLYAELKKEDDPARRLLIEKEIEDHKEPRYSSPPNRNRRRGYRNQNGMLAKE